MDQRDDSRRQAWETMHAALWGQHEWAPGSIIPISRAGSGRFGLAGTAPVHDADTAWRIIERADRGAGAAAYVGMGVLQAVPHEGRGTAADVTELGWLWADVDTADGEHKPSRDRLPHPTQEQAQAVLDAAPWGAPTLTVHSGGGLHVYYVLTEPVDAHASETRELLERFNAWLVSSFNSRGYAVDKGISADIARVLRPAGTVNRKRDDRPVHIVDVQAGRCFDVDELMSWLPEVPAPVAHTRPERTQHGPATSGPGDRPGDRLNRIPDALAALLEGEGLRSADRDGVRWVYPRPDGSYSREDAHAVILTGDDGVERVYVHGARMAADWGVAHGDAWSAFEVLAHRRCASDFALAARLVAAHERTTQPDTTNTDNDDEEVF